MAPDTDWVDWSDVSGTETSITVTDLTAGTAYIFQVRAVNEHGESAASESSEVTIPEQPPSGSPESSDEPTASDELKTATGNSTASVARTMVSSVNSTIGGRIINRSGSFGSGTNIGGQTVSPGQSGKSLQSRPPTGSGRFDEAEDPDALLSQMINNASFNMALGGREEHSEYSDAPQMVFWGGGDLMRFKSKTFEINGKVRSGYLGVEGLWNNGILGGGALSYQVGETRYAYEESGNRKTGRIDTRVSSFHPYASMDVNENFRVWGIAGFGSGEMSNRPEAGGRNRNRRPFVADDGGGSPFRGGTTKRN